MKTKATKRRTKKKAITAAIYRNDDPEDEPKDTYKNRAETLTARQVDTIIAALRARQGTAKTTVQEIEEIATEHGPALSNAEIDELVLQINTPN